MPAQHNSHQHQSHNQCITMQCAPGRSSSQRQHPGADQPGDVTPNCCTRACKGPALTAHGGIGNTAAQRSHHGPSWGHLVALVILVATSNLSCIDAQSWLSMSSSSSSSSLLSGNPTEPLHMRRSSLSTHPYHTTSRPQEQVELEAAIADDISPAILIAILASSLLLILIILMVIHRFRVLSAPSAGKHHDSKADDSLRDEHIVDERPKASASIVRRESTKAERSQENRHSGIGLAKRHGSLPFSTRPSVAMMRSFDTPSTSFSSYLHLKSTDSGGDVGDDPAAMMMSESILASSLDMARTPHTLLGTAYSSLPMSSDQHILGDHHQHHWSAAAYSSARRHDNHRRQHNDYVLQQPRAASSRLMSSMTSYPSLQVTSSLGSEASHCLDDEEDERNTRRDDEVGSRTSKSSQNILQLVTFPPCSSDDDDDDIIDGDENDQAPTPPGAILRSRVSSASFSLATHHNSTRSLHGEIHRTRSGREHLHGSHNPVLFRRADSCQSLVDRTVSGESQRSANNNNNNSGGGGGGGMRMSTSRSHTASFTCIVQARQDSEHDASGSGGVRLTRNRSSAAAQQDESHDRSADHAVMHACQPEQRVVSPTADPACRTDSLMSSPMEMTSQSARNASASNTAKSSRTNTSSSSHSERNHAMAPNQSSTLMQSQPSHPHSEAGHRHHYHGDRGQGHSILTAPVHARQVFVSERQGIFRRTSSYHRSDTAPQQREPPQHDQTQRVPQGRVQIPQQQLAVSVLPSLVPTLPRHSTLQYQRTGENIVLHGKPSKSSSMPSLQDLTDAPVQPGTLQSLAHTLHDTGDARHHHQDHNGVLKYPPSRHGGAKSQWVPHLGTPSDSVDHTRIATGAADNKERRAGAMEAERQGYCNSSSADTTPVLSPISDTAAASAAAAVATAAEQHRMLRQAASLPVGGVYTSDEGATSTDSTTPSSSATSSDSEVVSPSAPLQMPTIDMLYGWHPTQPSQQQVQAPMNQPGEGAHRRPVDADPHYVYEQYPLSSLDLLPMDAVQTVPAANQPVHGQAEPIPVPSTDDVGTPHMLYRSTSPRPGAMKRRKLSETQDTVAPEHGADPEQPPDVERKRHSRGSWNFKHQLHQSVETGLSTAEIYRRASTEYSGSRGSQYYLGARSAGVSTASKHWHLDRLTAPPTVDKSTAAAAAAHEHQWSVAHRGEITEDTVSFGVASMQENDLTPAASFGSQLNRAAATAVSDTRHYHNFGSMHVPLSSRSHHESNKELPGGYASGMPRPQLHEDHAIPLPLTRKNVVASSSAQRASNTSSGGGGGGGGGGGSAIQQLYAGRYPPLEVDGKKTSRQVSSTSIASQSDSSGTAATSSTLTPDTGFYGYECDVQL
ncbi:uncharacterized protein LOC135811331 isoform X2 [Sycon ciliatum]|uniref:uncharacterized protein LOC135811331 isoform X2 n=1 Tax=Sycon ciliatum TaxID=27933 RepID=UPI0031F70F0E